MNFKKSDRWFFPMATHKELYFARAVQLGISDFTQEIGTISLWFRLEYSIAAFETKPKLLITDSKEMAKILIVIQFVPEISNPVCCLKEDILVTYQKYIDTLLGLRIY